MLNLFTKMGEYSDELMAGALQDNPTSYVTDKFTFVFVRAAMRAVRAKAEAANVYAEFEQRCREGSE